MNLQQAVTSGSLTEVITKEVCPCEQPRVSAMQLAKKVFKIAAARKEPFTNHTPETWSRKWMASNEYVLLEIPIMAAAVPNTPFNVNRVLERLHSAADMMEPIVVDLNKRKVGRSAAGYIPAVIVLDGKHRITTAKINGAATIKAWVGVRALGKLKTSKPVELPAVSISKGFATKVDAAAQLSAGMNMTPVPRQDVGDGGSEPTMRSRKMKADASDKQSVQDPSDENWPPDASDRKPGMRYDTAQTRTNTSQMNDVPAKPSNFKIPASPSAQSPGGDAGFRYDSKGATRSENQKKVSDGGPSGMGTGRNKGGATRSELTQVMGGGPGSGRHAVTGLLTQHGYTKAGGQGNSVTYSHKSGNRVSVHDSGWSLAKKNGSSTSGDLSDKGTQRFAKFMRIMHGEASKCKCPKGKHLEGCMNAGKISDKIYTEAPPGFSEETMHQLKREHGTEGAFKIAWSQHNKKKSKN